MKRRLTYLVVGLCVLVVGCATTGDLEMRVMALEVQVERQQAVRVQAGTDEVRAKGFVLVDDEGRERAMLVMTKDGPALFLSDENGELRAGLAAYKDGPGLALFDEEGEARATLVVGKHGPEMSLFDETGKERTRLTATKDGPGLSLLNAAGKIIWQAP